jgi:hypothetical protein
MIPARRIPLLAILACAALAAARPSSADPPPTRSPSDSVEPDPDRARAEASVRKDLAERLKVPLESVRVADVQERTWPDARLGCASRRGLDEPQPVRGFRVVLSVDDRRHIYHTDRGGRFVRCDRPGKPLGPIE